MGHPGGRPLEVVVELDAEREEGLLVEEVHQPALLAQVAQKAEVTGRIAHGDQVLQERDLHGRVVDQHAAVPAEARLPFQEEGVEPLILRQFGVALVNGYGKSQI